MLTSMDTLAYAGNMLGAASLGTAGVGSTSLNSAMDTNVYNQQAFSSTGTAQPTVPTGQLGFVAGLNAYQMSNGAAAPPEQQAVATAQDSFAAAAAAAAANGVGATGINMLMYRMVGNAPNSSGYTGSTGVQPAHFLPFDTASLEAVAQQSTLAAAAAQVATGTAAGGATSSISPLNSLPSIAGTLGSGANNLGASLTAGTFGATGQTSNALVSTPSAQSNVSPASFTAMQLQYLCYPQYRFTSYGGLRPLVRTPDVRCETCDITLNSPAQARQHFAGKSHLRRLNPKAGGNKRNRGKTKEGGDKKLGGKRKREEPEDIGSNEKNKDNEPGNSLVKPDNARTNDNKISENQIVTDCPDRAVNEVTNTNNTTTNNCTTNKKDTTTITKTKHKHTDYNDNDKHRETDNDTNCDTDDLRQETNSNAGSTTPGCLIDNQSEQSSDSGNATMSTSSNCDETSWVRSESRSPVLSSPVLSSPDSLERSRGLVCTCGGYVDEDDVDNGDNTMSGLSGNNSINSNTQEESPAKKMKTELPCTVCNLMFNSESQYTTHMSGSKHAARVASSSSASGASSATLPPKSDVEHYCNLCVTGFTSAKQLASHLGGSKHLRQVKLLPEGSPELLQAQRFMEQHATSYASAGSNSMGKFRCTACDLSFNSSSQHQQHLTGRKHEVKLCELRGEEPPVKETKPQEKGTGAEGGQEQGEGVTTEATVFTCVVCQVQFNSESQANAHLFGSKHRKRTNSIAAATSGHGARSGLGNKPADAPMSAAIGKYGCEVCNVHMNSFQQLEVHKAGFRHKMAVDARTAQYANEGNPLGEVVGQLSGMYYCSTCNISVTTAALLHKHMNTPGHLSKKSNPPVPGQLLEEQQQLSYYGPQSGGSSAPVNPMYSSNTNSYGPPIPPMQSSQQTQPIMSNAAAYGAIPQVPQMSAYGSSYNAGRW